VRSPTEDRLELVLEATRAGIWDADLDSGAISASGRFDAILGDAAGSGPRTVRALMRRIVPEHRARVFAAMRSAIRTRQPFVVECRVTDARGAVAWLHARGKVLDGGNGAPTRILGVVVDTTDEATANLAQEEQDRFLQGVNAALPLIVYVVDWTKRQLRFANRCPSELFGFAGDALEALLQEGGHRLVHPDDAALLPSHAARIERLAEGAVDSLVLHVRRMDGEWRWIRLRNSALRRHEDGSLWQVVGTAEDVTEQVMADARLREHERELARAQEIARIGSWTEQLDTGALTWSLQMYRILGLDPTQVQPSVEAVDAVLAPEERTRLRAAKSACRLHGTPVDEHLTLRWPDGQERHVQVLAERRQRPNGTPLEIVGTVQDVTEEFRAELARTQLESQTHQTQKLESLGLLAGGIAHDFNNLLVGVLSNASLALLDLDESTPTRDVVLEIERTAQRAADLTRQLLAYSGKGRFIVERLQLSDLAAEMANLLRTVISKDATLVLELAEALPAMRGDATQLRQVIMNLITNASDALEGRPGTITIRTFAGPPAPDATALLFGEPLSSRDLVSLEVADTGTGMSHETALRVFDPFFSTKFTGRGLGLAAALGIVRGHQGQIAVSSALGLGTRFVLSFPARAGNDAERVTPTSAPVIHDGRVLVCDDDAVVRGVASALLSRRGFTVETVGSGHDALALLAQSPTAYRFLLLDLTMPGVSGLEVLRSWRAQERHAGSTRLPVFLMSGYSAQDIAADAEGLAISGFLQKPFTLADLDNMLAALPVC
jgi:PAS domain S-box-containing protein